MENAQLTIADLASLKQIIDAACTRGAFKAAEMKSVGDVYDKLSAFLDAVVAQQQAQEAEQAEPPQGDTNA
jgi:pyrroloquinoline quinone (PQQ) biosynthesis protein C